MNKLSVFARLAKVDAAQRIIECVAVEEVTDRVKEVFDYASSKPFFEKWSSDIEKATNGKSLGNLRAMHGKVAAGKLTQITFDDVRKGIPIQLKVVDDAEWAKVEEGVYSGVSIGGTYVKKWKDPTDASLTRYTCDPAEISLVDYPCVPTATFDVVKDGATVQKHFQAGTDAVVAKAGELAAADGKDAKDATVLGTFEKAARAALAKDATPPPVVAEVAEEAPGAGAATTEPTNDEVVAKATELAKTKGGVWTSYTEEARAALMAGASAAPGDRPAPGPGPAAKSAQATAPGPGGAVDGDWEQVWVSKRLPGARFKSKAELRTALTELDATEKAAGGAAPALAAIAALKDRIGGVTVQTAAELLAAEVKKGTEALGQKNDAAIAKAIGCEPAVYAAAEDWARANPKHEVLKALATASLKFDRDGNVIEVTPEAVTALKAVVAAAAGRQAPTAEELATLEKAGEARGALVLKTKDDLSAALAGFDFGPAAKRFFMKRARALKAAELIPADWLTAMPPPAKDATDEVKKGATLYGLCRMIELLASLQNCEQGLEYNDIYCGVAVPAEMQTRFGTMLVDFGDLVADILDVLLQSIRDEEAGEAMTRVTAAGELLKGVLLAGDILQKFAAPAALAKLAPTGAPEAVDDLQKQVAAQASAFEKTVGTILTAVEELAERLKTVEDTPLPPGTSTVTKNGARVVEKNEDTLTPAGTLTTEQALAQPGVMEKFAEAAIRLAQTRPVRAVPGHNAPLQG